MAMVLSLLTHCAVYYVTHCIQAFGSILSKLSHLLWLGCLQVGINMLQIPLEGFALQLLLEGQTIIDADRKKKKETDYNE